MAESSTTETTPGGENSYERGKRVLRETVTEDGGLQGLFTLARLPGGAEALLVKYKPLLRAAVSPEEREERKRKKEEDRKKDEGPLDATDKMYMEIASVEGLHPDDVPYMLLAASFYFAAFPSVSQDKNSDE